MSDHGTARVRLPEPQVFGDRVYLHRAPIEVIFRALADVKARWWLGLEPGEVEPEVLEALPHERVMWSSLWPVSPDDVIRFELSEVLAERQFLGRGAAIEACPTEIRMRWFSDYPPDDRGIAITRLRLNDKIAGHLQAVTSAYGLGILPPDGTMPPRAEAERPPWAQELGRWVPQRVGVAEGSRYM